MGDESMSDERMLEEKLLDECVVRALESAPDVTEIIPADFAARVAMRVPARRPVTVTPTHYGRKAMIFCGVLLLVLLVAMSAKGAERSTFSWVLEWCLYAQFVAVAIWFGTRRLGEG